VTANDLEKRCGYFFDFLSRTGRLDMSSAAGVQVTSENVQAYVAELKDRIHSVTVYGSIQKLRRITQLIAPDRDVCWLIDIERQLYSEMRPRSKWDKIVYTSVLADAGFTLMREAEISNRPKLSRARTFRNGLMTAFLGLCPVRSKNFAALEIGRSFVNVGGKWWVVLSAPETKEKREDERPADEQLTDSIQRYLEFYRPILARGKAVGNALWLAWDGKPMSYAYVGELITETTRMTVGIKVSPHLFRTAGVTTLATHAGDNPHAGGALLHHSGGPVTQENYNRASCITAGRSLATVNAGYRRS
jgi:integrase